MISELITYGSALYWALLFFLIYLLTIFVEQRTNTLRPKFWLVIILLYVFGFTSFSPEPREVGMTILAYLFVGVAFATYKWINLVGCIRQFTDSLETVAASEDELRLLASMEFQPNDAEGRRITLPPDPYEFRTRIWLWFMYWPVFTFFRPLSEIHKKVARATWTRLNNLSKKIYDSRD